LAQMIASLQTTREILKRHGMQPQKKLGQHFLVEPHMVQRIVDAAEIGPRDVVVEIGPGIGTMTQFLAQRAALVVAVELDRRLLAVLKDTLGAYPNVRVAHGDILQVNLDRLVQDQLARESRNPVPYRVVANLPYYITTPIIMYLLEEKFAVSSMVLMVQREVARRIVAQPGSKDYGALSVGVQYRTRARQVLDVPPGAFWPPPEVHSAVIRLDRREQPAVHVPDEKLFFAVVRAAFGQRRKTVHNALSSGGLGPSREQWLDILHRAGENPQARGEQIGLAGYAAICRELWEWRLRYHTCR